MKMNKKIEYPSIKTHEGAVAMRISAEKMLRRSVLSCLLWEKEFYEEGQTIADRIDTLCAQVSPEFIGSLAIEARTVHHLRHVPLLLLCNLAKYGKGAYVGDVVKTVISRADELTELVAIYWRKGKCPLSAQLKRGLGEAFGKFDAYQLAKYNRDGAVKLRDVLFMSHAKPADDSRAALYKQLANNELPTPDTWEVALSGGADKKATFERLIREGNLGYFALLRNLRNMIQSGVDSNLVTNAILNRKNGADKILPFRFIAAARYAPQYEPALDAAMQANMEKAMPLSGRTVMMVDVSGSMSNKLSQKSDLTRIDAAAGLASIVVAENLRVFSFSNRLVEVPPRRGMAGIDAIRNSQHHGGTYLGRALTELNETVEYDRLIVITDEQTSDNVLQTKKDAKSYLINVASARNGIGYGQWTHLDGFSENVVRYIHDLESTEL